MYNPVIFKESKIFQIYPLIKRKKFLRRTKNYFYGKIFFKPDENLIKSSYLQENKNKILKNFGLIDDRKFWDKNYEDENIDQLLKNIRLSKHI